MIYTRPPNIDSDIDIDAIKSPVIRDMIGKFDSLYDGTIYYFTDLQNRFFVHMRDYTAYYDYQEEPAEFEYRLDNDMPPPEYTSFLAPIMTCIYVPLRQRGRHIQRMFLDYLFDACDKFSSPMAAFVDPFTIIGETLADNAQTALVKFAHNGIDTPANWLRHATVQRERLMKSGFRNIKYNDGTLTEPWQQLLYLPETAPAAHHELANALEQHYTVNWEKLDQLD